MLVPFVVMLVFVAVAMFVVVLVVRVFAGAMFVLMVVIIRHIFVLLFVSF